MKRLREGSLFLSSDECESMASRWGFMGGAGSPTPRKRKRREDPCSRVGLVETCSLFRSFSEGAHDDGRVRAAREIE